MTVERLDYCRSLDHDVLVVTESWRQQENFTNNTNEFTTSSMNRDKDGNLIHDEDPAAGVGILFSPRA